MEGLPDADEDVLAEFVLSGFAAAETSKVFVEGKASAFEFAKGRFELGQFPPECVFDVAEGLAFSATTSKPPELTGSPQVSPLDRLCASPFHPRVRGSRIRGTWSNHANQVDTANPVGIVGKRPKGVAHGVGDPWNGRNQRGLGDQGVP